MLTLCCGGCWVAFAQGGEFVDLSKPRIWTAVTGHQLKATYEGREGNKIRLLVNDGKVKTILWEKLSKTDQQLLDDQLQKESREEKLTFQILARTEETILLSNFLLKRSKNASRLRRE